MPNIMRAPIESEPTTTCLNVDKREWLLFLDIMRNQGRSASDRVREMIRETVREHQAEGNGRAR